VIGAGVGLAPVVSGGYADVARWTGNGWAALAAAPAGAAALAVFDGQLVAGGTITNGTVRSVQAWDGGAWHALGQPLDISVAALAADGGRLAAGGARGSNAALAVWDGTAWSDVPGIGGRGVVWALHWKDGELYAGGWFVIAGAAASIARWDGAQWHALGGGVAYSTTSDPASVYVIDDQPGGLLIGGTFTLAGGEESPSVAVWGAGAPACYANCDCSTAAPVLNAADFVCFMARFVAGDPYANCDGSTAPPVLNVSDFVCFQQRFAEGCR
jgi:hypothetical protein